MMLVLQTAGVVLFAGGTAYLLLALWHVARFRPRPASGAATPAVTVMMPAHGATPRLYECMRAVCEQDYPAEYQVVFGLHSEDDAARPIIERLMAELPGRDIQLVIDATRIGANPKNCNLANMMKAVRHDILVMVDSDVIVERDFLRAIVAPFAEQGVGGVTCVYTGLPEPTLAAHLGAAYHNDWFIPSALVDVARGEMDICYGAAIAVTRHALDTIGGFAAMADAVAQDFVFGHELTRKGFKIRLAATVVGTVVFERTIPELLNHELRWIRNIRAVRPREHALWVFTSTLAPMAVLACSLPVAAGAAMVAVHLALRLAIHLTLRARIRNMPKAEPLLVPFREMLNFVLWVRSFLGRRVSWAGRVMVTGAGLKMRMDG